DIFSTKDEVENEIRGVFNTIKDLMPDKINFNYKAEIDNFSDTVTTVYATNPTIEHQYIVLTYDFDNRTIFPVKITLSDGQNWMCQTLDDVKGTLHDILSQDDFMIRLISISKEKGNLIDFDDIPF
ncbi:TPA: hypothetical protein QHX34_001878, partial [Klebsiella aerogenes]|nr:hypothetical protein [Klebsiella aerogenes]